MSAKELTIIRTPKGEHRPFFSTARETAQDSALTFEARGVLWYLLSKPDDWKVQWQDIANQGGFGRDKAKSIMAELRAAGYVVTEMKHGEHGKFAGKVDRIYETKQTTAENRSTEQPSDGLASKRRNRRIHNKEKIQNTETNAAIAAQAGGEPPLAVVPAEKPRDLIFDALALGSFGIAIGTKVSSETASRVGLLKKWLKNNYGGATDATVGAFYRWYDTHENGASRPRDVKKFASAFDKFHAEVDARKNGADHSAKMADLMNLHAHDLALSEKKGA